MMGRHGRAVMMVYTVMFGCYLGYNNVRVLRHCLGVMWVLRRCLCVIWGVKTLGCMPCHVFEHFYRVL